MKNPGRQLFFARKLPQGCSQSSWGRFIQAWGQICELYSKAFLTYTADRRPAFAGIVEEACSCAKDEIYIAGAWLRSIEQQLTWVTIDPCRARRPQLFRAPSWSWLSIDGAVECLSYGRRKITIAKQATISTAGLPSSATKFPGSFTNYRLHLESLVWQGHFTVLSQQESLAMPEDPLETTSARIEPDSMQRLRFTELDSLFSVVQKTGIEFYFDYNYTFEGSTGCYLLCLILETGYPGWHLRGLVLVDESDGSTGFPELTRLGTFVASNETACIIARHSTCDSEGCDFDSLSSTDVGDIWSMTEGKSRPPVWHVTACHDFFEDTNTTTQVVIV